MDSEHTIRSWQIKATQKRQTPQLSPKQGPKLVPKLVLKGDKFLSQFCLWFRGAWLI